MDDYCRLRWEHPTNRRYYEVIFSQDLLGDWCLQKIWGRKGSALGQVKKLIMTDFEMGQAVIAAIDKRRKTRGYHITLKRGTPW